MTQFSSGAHDKLTADPAPWAGNGTRASSRKNLPDWARPGAFNPRPEFDRPLTNPANPILWCLRIDNRHVEIEWTPARYDQWLADETTPMAGVPEYEPEEIDHARKVLQRLVAVFG